ncbi:zinc finger protein 3 homolog [Spea bombifrons]|uniref:zinc finger protein 3 homolog n=1 Tax=Spea bombifrons TaxID=233779 RepID=UPI0023497B8B|nr:zinc finger protein 3 homolog [Spea bombifrons]
MMVVDKDLTLETVLKHTLEIVCLLTGEDYIVVKKMSENGERKKGIGLIGSSCKNLGPSRENSDLVSTGRVSGVKEAVSEKITELANKIIQLLTKKVPLKHDDVAVYFTTEEWDYVEVHKEDYSDVTNDDVGKDIPQELPLDQSHETDDEDTIVTVIKVEPDDSEYICTEIPQFLSSPEQSEESDFNSEFHIKEDAEDVLVVTINEDTMKSSDYENSHARKSQKSGEKMHPCDVCGKRFRNNSHLARHFTVHTGEKPYPCNVCGKMFARKSHVADHKRIHTGEKPYTCKECGRKFTNNSHLVLHRVVHTGEKPFTCPECGKGFTRNSSLIKHSGIHAEEKPHVCRECGKSYCQYANLVVHQRLHSGEKPYVCKYCGRGFICKASMVRHQRTHTGEKPFSCAECGKTFTDNSSLIKHKRVHVVEEVEIS